MEEDGYQYRIMKLQLEREVAKKKAGKLRKLELQKVEGELKLAEHFGNLEQCNSYSTVQSSR